MGESGATVLLVARSEGGLHAVEREILASGGSASVLPTDLCDPESTQALVENVRRDHGGVDVLVSNAGRSIRRSIGLSYDRFHDFQRTVDVNYLGPVRLVLGLLPSMRERRHGHVINVSSLGVLFSAPRFSAYLGSKSAFDAFLRCVAPEVREDGVAITNIYMPLVRTPMMEPTHVWGWLPSLSPEQAAERICRAVVKRPVEVASGLARVGRIAHDLSPAGYEALLEFAYRDHERTSAQGDGVVDDIEVPRIQSALEKMGRVASWRRSKKT